jgi:hypothetical protein
VRIDPEFGMVAGRTTEWWGFCVPMISNWGQGEDLVKNLLTPLDIIYYTSNNEDLNLKKGFGKIIKSCGSLPISAFPKND